MTAPIISLAAYRRAAATPAEPPDPEPSAIVAELEGRTVLSCYALQRVCWELGWLRCGTCEVTAEGWAEIGEGPESRRAA